MWFMFYTGSKRFDRGRGKTFRHVRTTQERRANCGRQPGVGSRYRKKWLPEYRDEILRHVDRSWKSHRRTQYRPRDSHDGRPAGGNAESVPRV